VSRTAGAAEGTAACADRGEEETFGSPLSATRTGLRSVGEHACGEATMPLLRRRQDDGGTKYRMREKLFAIGDDFWIEDENGDRAFKVDGKALRIRKTLVLEDPSGAELFTVQEKKLHIRDTMDIERGGKTAARVKKALITPLRERFSIEVEGGAEDLEAKGNIADHEYKIERDGKRVAEVSKRWFRVRDTYGIEMAPGEEDDALILAATVCIDQMTRA
jgi:uncharacterized protein YxjI